MLLVPVANMRLLSSLALLATTIIPAIAVAPTHKDATVYVWPAHSSKPQVLAQITYDIENLTATLNKFTPPQIAPSNAPIRIGLWDSKTSEWRGVAASSASFDEAYQNKITLHVGPDNTVYHVGFNAFEQPRSKEEQMELDRLKRKEARKPGSTKKQKKKSASKHDEQVIVEVVKASPAPAPHLNKPVVLDADGKLPKKEQEQTFLQKYWYVHMRPRYILSCSNTLIQVGHCSVPHPSARRRSGRRRRSRRWEQVKVPAHVSTPYHSYEDDLRLVVQLLGRIDNLCCVDQETSSCRLPTP